MDEKISVRTTFQPDRDLEVDMTEARDLFRQGLLVDAQPAGAKAGQSNTTPPVTAGGNNRE